MNCDTCGLTPEKISTRRYFVRQMDASGSLLHTCSPSPAWRGDLSLGPQWELLYQADAEGVLLYPGRAELRRIRQGFTAGAIAALIACGRKGAGTHLESAAAYEAKRDYAAAIVEYRAALQQDPKLGEARIKLGDIYARNGDAQNAFREYVRAADTLPDNIDAQLKAGALLLLSNEFTDAKARAEAVLQLSPRIQAA